MIIFSSETQELINNLRKTPKNYIEIVCEEAKIQQSTEVQQYFMDQVLAIIDTKYGNDLDELLDQILKYLQTIKDLEGTLGLTYFLDIKSIISDKMMRYMPKTNKLKITRTKIIIFC